VIDADVVKGFGNQDSYSDVLHLVGITSVFYQNADVTDDGTTDTTLYTDRNKTKVIAVLESVDVDLTTADFNVSRILTNRSSIIPEITTLSAQDDEIARRHVTPEESREFQDAILALLEDESSHNHDLNQYLTVTEIA